MYSAKDNGVDGAAYRRRLSMAGMGRSLGVRSNPGLIVALIASGLFFGGYNSLAGMAVAYLLTGAAALLLLTGAPPEQDFWHALRWPAGLGLAALGWQGLNQAGVLALLGGHPPLAPDYFLPNLLGLGAAGLACLSGMLMGRERREFRLALRWLCHWAAISLAIGILLWSAPAPLVDMSLSWRGRFAGLIGNANVSAVVGGMVVLLALDSFLEPLIHRPAKRPWRSRAALAAVPLAEMLVGATAMSIASSRITILVTLALVLLTLALRLSGRRWRARWPVLAVAVAGMTLAVLLPGGEMAAKRFDYVGFDASIRLRMWDYLAGLAMMSPFNGYGPGSFSALNEHFLTDERLAEQFWNINSAHNVVLQILLNGGLPYLALVCGGVLLLWRDIVRYVHGGASRWRERLAAWKDLGAARRAALCACALMLACASVDIVLDVPAMTCLFFFLTGLLWGRAHAYRRRRAGADPARSYREAICRL